MGRIFLNYRRDDADVWADMIYRPLKLAFDDVFMDVDGNIPVGFPWADWLDQQVQACDALVALIGRRWVEEFEARSAPGARDFVRVEIESALRRGVPVAPVFLGDAPEPDLARIPEGVRPLLDRQAFRVRRGRDLDGDLAALVEALKRAIALHQEMTSTERERREAASTASEAPADERRWRAMLDRLGAGVDGGFRERLRFGGEGPAMVALKGGVFTMGSNESDREKPPHRVTVPPFAIGRFAVTFGEYDAYCSAKGVKGTGDQGWGRGRRPAISVSRDDAQDYCGWLSEQTGAEYRLPSEAEWEFACRAGSQTRWSFGDEESALGAHAWFLGNSGEQTHPVGEKEPNAFGLYDMHGNVREWCQDAWNDDYSGAPSDGSAWMSGDESGAVLRGGSWLGSPGWLRSAYRDGGGRGGRGVSIGFRVARTLRE